MLLNISNHTTYKWPKDQIEATINLYQSVMDMNFTAFNKDWKLPFPEIDPFWQPTQISDLAKKVLTEIIILKPEAVHIMGEMTFTFALVNLLKDAGVKCIASTTKRNVEEIDGKQVSTFQFVQFREY